MNKIDLNKIIEAGKDFRSDDGLYNEHAVKVFMYAAVQRSLELAAQEAKIIYDPIVDVTPSVDKHSILNVLKMLIR